MNGGRRTQRNLKKYCKSQGYTKTTYVNNILELTKKYYVYPRRQKKTSPYTAHV
jgi:hypothetical protein